MQHYVAAIHKDSDSDFGISFPDFPGCVSAAGSLDEAKEMAQEALQGHAAFMEAEGELLPKPLSLEQIQKMQDFEDAVAFLVVYVKSKKKEAVRINATFDPDLLAWVDETAAHLGISRSAFLAQAARGYLREHPGNASFL